MDRGEYPEPPHSLKNLRKMAEAFNGMGINLLTVNGKKPTGSTWGQWHDKPQTKDDVEALFRHTGITGISAITGPASKDLGNIDIDQIEDEKIVERVLKALGLSSTYPWNVKTPGHGAHIWFRCPELNQALGDKGKLIAHPDGCKQMELRWKKHQTLLPPSRHPNGGHYQFRSGRRPGHAPAEVTWKAIQKVANWEGLPKEPQVMIAPLPTVTGELDPYIQAALNGEVARMRSAREGERNDTLFKASATLGQLEQAGLPFEVASRALSEAARATGLKPTEIKNAIASGWKAGQNTPRSISGFSVPQLLDPLPAYPVEALPEIAGEYVSTSSRTMSCPPEMVGVPLLTYAGAAVGNTACLSLRPDWDVFPILWTAVVAAPGTAKSPADQAARRGLHALQLEAKARYDDELAQYKKDLSAFKEGARTKKEKSDHILGMRVKGGPDGKTQIINAPVPPDEEPERPKLEHFWTADATIEAVGAMLADSVGLAMCRDEILGWTNAFDIYKGGHGSERQAQLSSWSGVPLKIDRKGADTIFVPNPVCCVTGGIQPDVLHELAVEAGRRDGFLERFLFSIPQTSVSRWCEDETPVELWDRLYRLFRELRRPGTLPRRIELTAEAKRKWVSWYNDNAARTDLVLGLAEGASAKMPMQCSRLALILHCLTLGEKAGQLKLSVETLKAAIQLTEYHRAHGERVFALLAGGSDRQVRLREKLSRVLEGAGGRWLTRTELDRALGGVVPARDRDLVLDAMRAEGLVEHVRDESGAQGGRPVERWRWVTSEELKNRKIAE